jgi:hypothetical protein
MHAQLGFPKRNPMRDVKAPRAVPPRMSYLAAELVRALIDAQA